MRIDRIDHFVLTVASIEVTCAFYRDVLGMDVVTFAGGRRALSFGAQKINLHEAVGSLNRRPPGPPPAAAISA